MEKFGVGQPLTRKEDLRLLTGRGRFIEDATATNMVHARFVRAPHAHARIAGIDAAAARALPGVVAIVTGDDLADQGLGTMPCVFQPKGVDGRPPIVPSYGLLAVDRVRFVGDLVAMVIADSAAQAADAAEAVAVDYEALAAVTDLRAAAAPDAVSVWPEAPGNVSLEWQLGDAVATAAAFERAAQTVTLTVINNRVAVTAMETRGALAAYHADSNRWTLITTTQLPHPMRAEIAEVLGVDADRLRIVVKDVGGGFGAKNSAYPEQVLVCWAARAYGRPVRWIEERAESFLATYHCRDNVTEASLALDENGRFLGLKVDTLANLGAYISGRGALSPINNAAALINTYRTGVAHVRVRELFTHTVPTDVYRGAGRPEALYAIERLVDVAALTLGLDPAVLRRRNMIPPDALPYETPLGLTYDSGLYEQTMDDGLAAADLTGFADRRAAAGARGILRGLGFANFVERCGAGVSEAAELRITEDGRAQVLIGTMSNGQGHETAFAQVAGDLLGLDPALVDVIEGDTDRVRDGKGTGGSRSIPLGGAAIKLTSEILIDKARTIAGHHLEAAVADIEFVGGRFAVAGTDRVLTWAELARIAGDPAVLPDGMAPGLEAHATFNPPNHTFPNGCHVCEVEIDPDTGALTVARYTVVHDFGRILNPLLLTGQVHGGVAQGLGQAMFEQIAYDPGSGQLLSGSFMDYPIPRASQVPMFDVTNPQTPCPSNPMGFKGCGEAGAAGAPPALVNAAINALSPLGIRHIDMPLTPERVWRAIQQAKETQL